MITLVTGGTGLLGSAVVRRLLEAGHRVRVLVRKGGDRRNLTGLDVDEIEGDLCDRASLERAVAGCEALCHVGAEHQHWVADPERFYEVNVAGTIALLETAAEAGVARIVYTGSTLPAVPSARGDPVDEDAPLLPPLALGHYLRSKLYAEVEVRRLASEWRLPVVTVNPSTVAGPRDVKPSPFGRLLLAAARGWLPKVRGALDVVHVDDVADGHLLALERGRLGERYVLGGGWLAFDEILSLAAAATGRRPAPFAAPRGLLGAYARLAEWTAGLSRRREAPLWTRETVAALRAARHYSSEKARRELAYEARPAQEAVRDAVVWFRRQGYLARN